MALVLATSASAPITDRHSRPQGNGTHHGRPRSGRRPTTVDSSADPVGEPDEVMDPVTVLVEAITRFNLIQGVVVSEMSSQRRELVRQAYRQAGPLEGGESSTDARP